jgi:hypothetical protein
MKSFMRRASWPAPEVEATGQVPAISVTSPTAHYSRVQTHAHRPNNSALSATFRGSRQLAQTLARACNTVETVYSNRVSLGTPDNHKQKIYASAEAPIELRGIYLVYCAEKASIAQAWGYRYVSEAEHAWKQSRISFCASERALIVLRLYEPILTSCHAEQLGWENVLLASGCVPARAR